MTIIRKELDKNQLAAEVDRIIDKIRLETKPEHVIGMMGVIVSMSPDNPVGEDGKPMASIHNFAVGEPEDIRRMILLMIENAFEEPVPEDDNEDNDGFGSERVH